MYARLIAEKLLNHKLTIATAESVTGGLLSSSLTDIAGASRFFKGAIVAYSNELKKSLLNVKQSTLINHGAVRVIVFVKWR
ncbi:damage-inducible protein CinA-like protein [Mycoplasmoides pneumoniae]|uniref:Damage-inducible protein CinA-like protein n=1 Tax=Mycoplasmoides pneumoniae TaxID=2104 RepID=A0AB38W7U3_MYCPM|nr:damage-inducible protein CinA-like protein [Mycoplasmoides pneumoniae]